jgi:hypothetical protein
MGLTVLVARLPLASNGYPQCERFVFPLRSNVAAGDAVDATVGQDKGRIKSARPLTDQPAPQEKPLRPHTVNTTAPRSKNKPTPNERPSTSLSGLTP